MYKIAFIAPSIGNYLRDAKNQTTLHNAFTTSDRAITAQNPLSTNPADVVNMSPEQWMSTYDEGYQKNNPSYAARHKYYHPYQDDQSMGYAIGDKLRQLRDSWGSAAGDVLNKGPMIGGLASVVPGALLGAAGTGIANMFTGNEGNVLRNALLGGLLTGGLGAASGYLRKYKPEFSPAPGPSYLSAGNRSDLLNAEKAKALELMQSKNASTRKRAFANPSMDTNEAKARILQLISQAPGLSYTERSQLTAGVALLSGSDLSQLASSLSGVWGATAGGLIARFLMNKGLIGTVLGAIFGSTVAKAVFGPNMAKNFLGQPSMQGKDITGHYLQ